ncbi:molybdate transporter 2-like [Phalaenopsis equestris]|uniref:molybdate transporter 2-like n=1 Tax=Phalaenopsis equestris TaxID=78828 RepID=UPI0009E56908|nr:molybdate transporter 2-like [Phalaenopsis equestris]
MNPSASTNSSAIDNSTELRRPLFPPIPHLSSRFHLKTTFFSELSGSVGDLGTYIPIVLALSLVNGLDLGTTLLFTALYNAITGLLFGIPMPVQPMKSIAAVAISPSSHLSIPQIMAAGLCTASTLLILGATGLMSLLYRFLPLPVVRGVQLSQGLSFTFSAVSYISYIQDLPSGKTSGPRPMLGSDGLLLALSAVVFILLSSSAGNERRRLFPSALIVFLFGFILCFFRNPSVLRQLKLGPSPIRVIRITSEDWKVGFFRGAIPQIPLSILNSVIAVCKLSGDLFPDQEVSAAAVSVSVGLMNWAGCWFGAMPVCHGAGGLAGQYRFGGRSGLSVMFLAAGKMVAGLVFGNSFVVILREFPVGLLGVLLVFAGVELAMSSRDMGSKKESFVMLVCAAVSMKLDAGVGFVCGLVMVLVLWISELDWFALLRRRSGGGSGDDKLQSADTEEIIGI